MLIVKWISQDKVYIAKIKYIHIVKLSMSMLNHTSLSISFLNKAFFSNTDLINMLHSPLLSNESPLEVLFNQKLDYTFLKVFGYLCFPCLIPFNNNKLDPQSLLCTFLGYSLKHKGYKYFSKNGRMSYLMKTSFLMLHLFFLSLPSYSYL